MIHIFTFSSVGIKFVTYHPIQFTNDTNDVIQIWYTSRICIIIRQNKLLKKFNFIEQFMKIIKKIECMVNLSHEFISISN